MTICYPANTDWSCYGTDEEIAELDPIAKARSEALAWLTLARLTAYQIGVCPTTVRPCAASCAPRGSWTAFPVGSAVSGGLPTIAIGSIVPHINAAGAWTNSCGCLSSSGCGCASLAEVLLPGPVGLIESVVVDGEALPVDAYRVDDGNRLVRLDGGLWPLCQDLAAAAADAFSVTYYRGAAPNEITRWAAGILAREFYLACNGDRACRLPDGVQSITRDGVTYEIQTGMFEGGFTGIREVDTVIGIYNPYALKQAPTVTSPESRRRRARTTTVGPV